VTPFQSLLHIYLMQPEAVFWHKVNKDGNVNDVNDGKAKHKAISGYLFDHFGFNLSDDDSVSSVENVYCVTCDK